MASPASPPTRSQTADKAPLFGALVPYRQHTEIKLTQLIATLHGVAPSCVIGDWSGPFTTPPADKLGTGMLSIDGAALSLLNVNQPLPHQVFDVGRIPNALLPDPAERLRDHRAHVVVVKAGKPVGRAASIAAARAATLLSCAAAILTGAEAFKWEDANNFVPVSLLQLSASMLARADGLSVEAWVRVLAVRVEGGKGMAGSYGLWAFGLPEIEFAPSELPIPYLMSRTHMVSDFLLRSTRPIANGHTIDVDGENVFKVETVERGFFTARPALRLSWLAASPRHLGPAKS